MQGSFHTTGSSDTIAALSTPAGVGGVGVIRLSGPRAADILAQCFRPAGGGRLEDHPPRQMVYGRLLDREGQTIDRCLAFYTAGTASFTGEITGELHCHGSPMVLSLALETLFALGCRQAGPGEFTRRAFCSGKLDLAQSEAVADLLEARSREGVRHAAGRLGGALSRRIEEIYQALTQLDAHFCAVLDYPDEDLDPFTANTLKTALEEQRQALGRLTDSWRRGRQISQGVPCALVGRPNGGKSSLFNALVGYDRAIVTPIPGTTRDTVEERLELGGVPLRLIDTAGLRQSQDPIEQLGVERSRAAMEGAGLVLVLADGGKPLEEEDRALLARARESAPALLIRTKADLEQAAWPVEADVTLSARTGQGLEALEDAVARCFPKGEQECYGELLANARQAEAAGRALGHVEQALEALEVGFAPDAVLSDVEQALEALGELTGRTVREDVTDCIFKRFCVGK